MRKAALALGLPIQAEQMDIAQSPQDLLINTAASLAPGDFYVTLPKNTDLRRLCVRTATTANPPLPAFVTIAGDEPFTLAINGPGLARDTIKVVIGEPSVRFAANQSAPDRDVAPGDLLLTDQDAFVMVCIRRPGGETKWCALSLTTWQTSLGLPEKYELFASWQLVSTNGTKERVLIDVKAK